MLIAGHIGITLALAKYAPRAIANIQGQFGPRRGTRTFKPSWTERLDDRVILAGSMLPDLIDKPLALFIAPTLVGHSLRSYGHTLVFAVMLLAVAVVLALLAKRQWPVVLALASSGHLILDTMWYSHRILLWPFTSSTFSPRFIHEWGPRPDYLYLGAEILGLVVICWIGLRLIVTRNFGRWLLTGQGA